MSKPHRFVKQTHQVKSKTDVSGVKAAHQRTNRQMNNIICTLCYGVLNQGKMLKCFHTFCSSCLEKRASQSSTTSMACPLCHHVTDMEHGISSIPDNVFARAQEVCDQMTGHCGVCEVKDKHAIVKCVECDQLMCEDCKSVHQKQKLSKKHKTVFLSEMQTQITASLATNNTCLHGNGDAHHFYCDACGFSVCDQCHNYEQPDHVIIDISEKTRHSKEGLLKIVEGVRSYLPYVKSNTSKADKEIETFKSNVKATKQKIIDHREEVKRTIDKLCESKLAELDKIYDACLKRLEEFRNEMDRVYISVRTLALCAEQILQFSPDTHIPIIEESLRSRLESIPKEIPTASLITATTDFTPVLLQENELGHVTVCDVPVFEFSPSDTDVPTFHCPGRPYTICPTQNGDTAWVVCDTPETIHLYTDSGAIKQIIKMPAEVNDICCLPDGKLLVTELKGRIIWSIDKECNVSNFTTISEAVRGISLNHSSIYVSNRGRDYQGVCVLDLVSVEIISEIVQNGNGAIFVHPDRLAVTSTGTIAVTDRGTQGSVIFVDSNSSVITTYLGKGDDIRSAERFEPWGICVDEEDRVFVTDRYNDCIHMLSSRGQFVKYILARDDGIRRPIGLASDQKGRLWIGNEDGSIKVFKYTNFL